MRHAPSGEIKLAGKQCPPNLGKSNHQKRSNTRRLRRSGFTPRAVQKRVMILPLGAEIIRSAQLRRSTTPQQRLALELHAEVLARGLR